MARINIEDSLLKDDKFTELCIKVGSRVMALGIICEAFILAQKYFLTEETKRLIPLNEFKRKKELHVLLNVGFAEEREGGIYISGSEKHFAWLVQKQNAGKKGGRPKRNKEVSTKPSAFPRLTEQSGETLLPPSSFLFSLSSNKNNIAQNEQTEHVQMDKVPKIKAIDCTSLYAMYPRKLGRKRGLEKCKSQIKTQDDFEKLTKAILKYTTHIRENKTEPKFIKHFDTFMNSWTDWLDPEVGNSIKQMTGADLWLAEKLGNELVLVGEGHESN